MKNYKLLITIILHFIFSTIHGQVNDNFAQLSMLPDHWSGNRDAFIVNGNGELQLSSSGAGGAYLSTPIVPHTDHGEWLYTVRLPFSPSANNHLRLWLLANQEDLLDVNIKGLFLQLGENGNQDAIELRWIENQKEIVLCRGEEGKIANSFHLRIKILKDNNQWRIFIDEWLIGYFKLSSQAIYSVADLPFMGLSCHYTSSNSNKFFFNEIYYGEQRMDTTPTFVEQIATGEDLQSIQIKFSKPLLPDQLLHNESFRIAENEIHPVECRFNDNKYNEIILKFQEIFEEGNPYHLQINNLVDLNDHILDEYMAEIIFHKIRRNDVVFSEIMAAPHPTVALPDAEYIEIYNRKSNDIVLKDWTIQIGKTVRSLPEIALKGNEYALIISEANAALFNHLDNCYAISSLSITDGGQQIILYNNRSEVIHSLSFKSSWHRESIKRNGGWSLEMIDSENPCHGLSNWESSTSPTGGTPGYANSIAATNNDVSPPEIERITLIDSTCVKLFFTEQIRIDLEDSSTFFQIDRGVEITRIEEVAPDFRALLIHFQPPVEKGKIYTLTVTGEVEDCVGWAVLKSSRIAFGIASPASKNDLIINEILTSSTHDNNYIEIYNRSSNIIEMGTILLGSGGDTIPKKAVAAVGGGCQLFPESYLVICKNKEMTLAQYSAPFPERLFANDSFPSFAKSSGVVFLTDKGLRTIDRVAYDDQMHYSMLTSINDVSLERIHFNAESSKRDSWKSAAASSGYGTPGYLNSQHINLKETEEIIEIDPEIISPDQDGFNDYATIRCLFQDTENRVSITIFDPNGFPVKQLVNNQYCGTESLFTWDGTTAQESRAPPGFYVVVLEYWNQNGTRKKTKKVIGVHYPH